MRYTIENLNDELAQALTSIAESNHRSFDEEVIEALKSRAQVALRRKAAKRLRALRKELFDTYGLFSDSTEIIRESRLHDH